MSIVNINLNSFNLNSEEGQNILNNVYTIIDSLFIRTTTVDKIMDALINKLEYNMDSKTIEALQLMPKDYYVRIVGDGYFTMDFRLILPLDQHIMHEVSGLTKIESLTLQRVLDALRNLNAYTYLPVKLIQKLESEIARITGRSDIHVDATNMDVEFNKRYAVEINKKLCELGSDSNSRTSWVYKEYYMKFYNWNKNEYSITPMECYRKYAKDNNFEKISELSNEAMSYSQYINRGCEENDVKISDERCFEIVKEYMGIESDDDNVWEGEEVTDYNQIVLISHFYNGLVKSGDTVVVHGIDEDFMNHCVQYTVEDNDGNIQFHDEDDDVFYSLHDIVEEYDTFAPVCVEIINSLE